MHYTVIFHFVRAFLLVALAQCAFAQSDASKPADVRLVIDVSGSMKGNDPNNLRQPAVDLLVRLLPAESKAGVWTFGKYVNMLVPHKEVDEQWKRDAKLKAKDINSVGLFTNIGDALERAAHDRASPSDTHKTSLILLTDGMVDIDKDPKKNAEEWKRIVNTVLPELKKAGYVIHTVALSDNADSELLEKLALSTDGIAETAHSADDLMRIFLNAFNAAAPAEQVPLEDNGFVVDSSVEEFTALIFRKQLSENTELISPDEQTYDVNSAASDVAWHRAANYDLITVKQPLEGEWKIRAEIDPASQITVVSDLNLRVKSMPNNAFKGEKIDLTFMLQEDGKRITDGDFLSLLSVSAKMVYRFDDTSQPETLWQNQYTTTPPPKGGVFKSTLPALEKLGVFDISVLVDGKTFQRRFKHRVAIRQPFMAKVDKLPSDDYKITVVSHGESIDKSKTQVAASITKPNRRRVVKPLMLTEFGNWQVNFKPDTDGHYSVEVKVTGAETDGKEFEYRLEALTIKHFPDSEFDFTEPEPQPVVEPEPEPEAKPEPEPETKAEPEPAEAAEAQAETAPDETAEQAAEEGMALPPWLIYALLGAGNLFLLGGGFILFKKLMSDGDEDKVLDQFSDDKLEEAKPAEQDQAEEPEPEPEPEEDMDPSVLEMDTAEDTEEEPPMEDLGAIFDEEEDEPEAEADSGVDLSDDSAFEMPAMDGIEDDAEPEADPEPEAPAEADESDAGDDFAEEMLKAQGLDLSEEELDDAITGLIDELDGSRDEDEDDKPAGDFDDFEDFDLDEDK